MLELRDVSKVYSPGTVNENCLFRHFSLTIPDGQFVSVVGSNGSGKTSLLNLVCGSIPVDEGSIFMGGRDITRTSEHRRYRNIGRVYQNPAMGTCGTMTLLENMAMATTKTALITLPPASTAAAFPIIRSCSALWGWGWRTSSISPSARSPAGRGRHWRF